MIEILMQNIVTGEILNITQLVQSVKWSTVRSGKASELQITMIRDTDLTIEEGSIIRVKKDSTGIFYGYIFKISEQSTQTYQITAYDQIRYLLNKETYVFKNQRADEIIKKIATDFQLQYGDIQNTDYIIPAMVEQGQTLLDMIYKALDYTLINTGEMFVLYDEYGSLCLKNVKDNVLDLIVGDQSLLTDYTYDRSISEDTYNKIKLVKPNKNTGKMDVYIVQDSYNMNKWGLLQYYEKINNNLNEAQIQSRAENLIKVKNRLTKSLKIDCIGEISVKAGTAIYVDIPSSNIINKLIVDSAEHTFNGSQHTMSLDLKVI